MKAKQVTTEQQGLADGETICLANLHLATAQQVFDQVVTHLGTQGRRAYDDDKGHCRYRMLGQVNATTGDTLTLKCAAGCLIADNEYTSDTEGHTWYKLGGKLKHCTLICELQRVHDAFPPEAWYGELFNVAEDYRLNYSCLDKFHTASDAVDEDK